MDIEHEIRDLKVRQDLINAGFRHIEGSQGFAQCVRELDSVWITMRTGFDRTDARFDDPLKDRDGTHGQLDRICNKIAAIPDEVKKLLDKRDNRS